MESHSPHGLQCFHLIPVPSCFVPHVFGWLLHIKFPISSYLRPTCILFLFFFFVDRFGDLNDGTSTRHALPPPARLPSSTSPGTLQTIRLIVVSNHKNGGHLRPHSHPSLYFLMGCGSAPQTKEQAEESVNPPPGACYGLTGSLSALI